jgi:hypothetical protein
LISVKTVCSMKSIRPSNICALLAKCRYSAASETDSLAASAAVVIRSAAGLLEHAGQRVQDLDPSLARLGTLAHRGGGGRGLRRRAILRGAFCRGGCLGRVGGEGHQARRISF